MSASTCCGPKAPTTLRSPEPSEMEAVTRLVAQGGLPTEGVQDAFPGYVVAEAEGRLVGTAGVEIHGVEGLLRSVTVRPERRGQGVGEALVRDRIRWARSRGLEALWLLTETAADFFVRSGFRAVGRDEAPEEIRSSVEFSSLCPSTATLMRLSLTDGAELKHEVRVRYAAAAREAASGGTAGCGCGCGSGGAAPNPITSHLYGPEDTEGLPEKALLASLGCGNPTALATLSPGERVLDLGSGGGIDVLLSARRVGPEGKAYGLDLTDEMLELARENQREAGVSNAEFLKGDMEDIPLPDGSIDVVISNCVINLAADKGRVLREAFRVLRPGGRFAVSDIVVRGDVPDPVRRSMELWVGCVAGALEEGEYRRLLAQAGFRDIEVEPTRVYATDDARAFLDSAGIADEGFVDAVSGRFMSAFVRARKPD